PPRLGRRGGSPRTTRCPGRSPGSGRLAGRSSCCLLYGASGICCPSWHACGPARCHAVATAPGCCLIPLESPSEDRLTAEDKHGLTTLFWGISAGPSNP